jgi:hypothetical protein
LLGQLKASSSDVSDGPVRGLNGLRLEGVGDAEAPRAAAAAAAEPGAEAAADFAKAAASFFPQEQLLFRGACVCTVTEEVPGAEGGAGSVVARIEFDAAAVDTAAMQLGECELIVEAARLRLLLPRRLLRAYSGLEVPMVLVAIQALPAHSGAAPVDPAATRAKFARKARTLTVTMPRAP